VGRSRGGLSTKIHARVDGQGRPIQLLITPGQAHDLTGAESLLAASLQTKPTTPIASEHSQGARRYRQHPQHDPAQEALSLDQGALS
jgi:transposase